VYQGAPTPVTAFMGSATKAAAFAALLRVLLSAFDTYRVDWRPAIWALAVLTMVVGSVAALVQSDVKRMLAYSSINHAGYILIGVEAASREGLESALFYLMVYAFMTIGSFAVVAVVADSENAHSIDDYRHLATRRPVLAGVFAFLLLAQAGIPPTGGFIAKLGVFGAAADAHSYALLVVGVVTSVISAYYYLRVILAMYGAEGTAPESDEVAADVPAAAAARSDVATGLVLTVSVAVVLAVGILPSLLLDFARDATLLF
jgi:NADH-quinone oxidoreductase subunit N